MLFATINIRKIGDSQSEKCEIQSVNFPEKTTDDFRVGKCKFHSQNRPNQQIAISNTFGSEFSAIQGIITENFII